MRFYEFAQPNLLVLKIYQQEQQQATTSANTSPTPFPLNTAPTPISPEPIKVYPQA
jgi:hypothetical protein